MAFWKNREDRATKEVANLSIVTDWGSAGRREKVHFGTSNSGQGRGVRKRAGVRGRYNTRQGKQPNEGGEWWQYWTPRGPGHL